MRRTLILLAVACAGVTLVAAGCGGDDDDEDTSAATTTATTGEALSKDAFITAADGVCAQGDKQINKEASKIFGQGQPSRQEQEQFVTGTVLPNVQAQVDGIRALTPPEGDEDQVNAILDAAQQAIDDGEQNPDVLIQGGSGQDPFAEANQLAEDYGLKSCGGD